MSLLKDKFLHAAVNLAITTAAQSKDTTKVGAVLIHEDVPLLAMFNGPVPGVLHIPCREERPEKYNWCAHAEQNIIARAARLGIRTEGLAIVSTHHPCASCADSIIVAGIKEVVYITEAFGPGSDITKGIEAARTKFNETGVKVRQYKYVCNEA